MELLREFAVNALIAVFYINVAIIVLYCALVGLLKLRRAIRKRKRRKTPTEPEQPKPAYPPMDLRLKE